MRSGFVLLFLAALAAPAPAQTTNTPEAQLGAALHEERVTGNLQAAIDGFKKVLAVKGVSRSLAAQAQYHIGVCYEKLGNQEARKAFESVLKNYGDQKDLAVQARSRLAAMSSPASDGIRSRLLWDDAIDVWGKSSADGRYFSFVDWSTCDLAVRDLATGQNRKLTNLDGCIKAQAEVEASAVSPDARRVAYAFLHYKPLEDGPYDLMVTGMDGKGAKTLMRGLRYTEPHSWSPDGKWIAALASYGTQAEQNNMLALVSPDTGEVRRLEVQRRAGPMHATFSPDGKWIAYSVGPRNEPPTLLIRSVQGDQSVEETLQNNAIMMGWTPDASGILFSRVREGKFDLYLLPVANGKAAGPATPIPTTADVGSDPAGVTTQGALLFTTNNRRGDAQLLPWTADTFTSAVPAVSIPAVVGGGVMLGSGSAHLSNNGQRLFVITPSQNSIVIRDLQSGSSRTIVPQMKPWGSVKWAHDDSSLLILGSADGGKPGVYRVDDATGKATMLAELPPDARSFVPSRDGKTIYFGLPRRTVARDLATGMDKVLYESKASGPYDLRLSHDGNRLGIRAGNLAVVDLRTGQVREIYQQPAASAESVWALDWSADDRQIYTIVRTTGLMDRFEMWIFSPEGGEPKRQKIPPEFRGLSFSLDGKYVLTSRVTQRQQLWALENFLPAKK